ncbi:uncharacterized protein NPIL_24301 [Nephila pilipes]|uniref:Uncharacterized protein n=1 Tax=Nephila pilipes TaxID=299642 RepID=A0A8X6U173_NEPPI|nr:uncharacterized protein NPIL_24301 [Nephila pilipes]
MDIEFSNKILFSNEAYFYHDGFVNRQNCRIWSSENPHMIVKKQMHVTIWCKFRDGGIIGPYFFESEAGQVVNVHGTRYHDRTLFFLPKVDDIDVDDMWFQQDGSTCPTASETIQLLSKIFPGRVLSCWVI